MPWSFPEIPSGRPHDLNREDITHMCSGLQEDPFSDRRRGNVYLRGDNVPSGPDVIASEAKQSHWWGSVQDRDCFVASLLAMTACRGVTEWLHGGSLQA